ncbi:MAG: amidohydrolase family protein [Pseudomonadales bacterium]|nr:amidohydrolase family protein [Pseudomonadales bacterium]MBL6814262.1 amidohydrolase family protein [Pseudomonadales bacterium]
MSFADTPTMLIKNARIDGQAVDLRIDHTVQAMALHLEVAPNETVLDARGGELLPGLHDHHIHLFAAAAAHDSVDCNVGSGTLSQCRALLEARLKRATGNDWIRGIDYQEQQVGELDRWILDELCPTRPVRIQHRSGKVWVCNSLALRELGFKDAEIIDGLERSSRGLLTGRIVRRDRLLAERLKHTKASRTPNITAYSRQLARYGIVGITDTSASNTTDTRADFQRLSDGGELLQHFSLMGSDDLDSGYLKILLDEDRLPDLANLVGRINLARRKGRNLAFHCVTHLELVFALAALAEAAPCEAGFDRIEHGAVVDDEMAHRLADLGLPVITQPGFLFTKGDQYLTDLQASELDNLYRFAGLQRLGVCVAASSDAPYGPVNPWQVISSAATRRTRLGVTVGEHEQITAEQALTGYLTPTVRLNQKSSFAQARRVKVGMPADLCVLQDQWSEQRGETGALEVRATLIGGSVVFDSTQTG